MVHYVRFLRPPHVSVGKKTVDVAAVVAVTTDLGDAFFTEDLELIVELIEANTPHSVLLSQAIVWQAYSRALKFSVQAPGKYLSRPARLRVTTAATNTAHTTLEVPEIIDVWSDIFQLSDKQRAEPIVERQLLLPNKTRVRQWEATGDSIARHIWDAGLGFLMYFATLSRSTQSEGALQLKKLLASSKVRRLKVLELGAGCGTVGIAFAHMVKCDMLLTDLEDAQAILERNIRSATPLAGSSIQAQVLDWATALDDSSNAYYDLILVSDCIYNPDSSLHLVETLRQLATRTPNVLILVGFKRRHAADAIFFDRMQQTNFEIVETVDIPLPHITTDQDSSAPTIEFYTFRMNATI